MKFLSLILFCFVVCFQLQAEEIRAELSLISPPAVFKEGEVLEGVLRVWPIENADLNEFLKLESETWANVFYIAAVENTEISPNNSDVVEAKLLLILKSTKDKPLAQINYQGKMINVQLPAVQITSSLDKDSNDYYILDQSVSFRGYGKIIFAFLVVSCGFILFYILKRKKIKIDPLLEKRKNFDGKFSQAKSRSEFEAIYAERNNWLSFMATNQAEVEFFFKVIEEHQYKKSWSDDDLAAVRNSFEPIRGSFK